MSDFTDRARAEAQTRRDPGGKPCRGWHSRSDAHDKGFVSGAWWAAELDPSDAEVEAAFKAVDDGVGLYDNMRAALRAARDARLEADG